MPSPFFEMHPSGTRTNKRKWEPARPRMGHISPAGPRSLAQRPASPAPQDYQGLLSSLPPTSWLYWNREDHFPTMSGTNEEMESPMLTAVPVLPKLRTIRFDSNIFTAPPDDRYLSSEEDLSSTGSDAGSSLDRWDPMKPDNDFDDDDDDESQFVLTAASGIDQQVARTIAFIAPGKPRLIDVYAFAPIQSRRARSHDLAIARLPEPPVRRRICEHRELDRILKSRSWISKAFNQEDPYRPRRLTAAPLDGDRVGSSTEVRAKLRRANSSRTDGSRTVTVSPAGSSVLASCDPSRPNTAQSKLRGVAQSLASAKRKARLAEAVC